MHRLIWVFAGSTGHFVGFVVRRLIYHCGFTLKSHGSTKIRALRGMGMHLNTWLSDWIYLFSGTKIIVLLTAFPDLQTNNKQVNKRQEPAKMLQILLTSVTNEIALSQTVTQPIIMLGKILIGHTYRLFATFMKSLRRSFSFWFNALSFTDWDILLNINWARRDINGMV